MREGVRPGAAAHAPRRLEDCWSPAYGWTTLETQSEANGGLR